MAARVRARISARGRGALHRRKADHRPTTWTAATRTAGGVRCQLRPYHAIFAGSPWPKTQFGAAISGNPFVPGAAKITPGIWQQGCVSEVWTGEDVGQSPELPKNTSGWSQDRFGLQDFRSETSLSHLPVRAKHDVLMWPMPPSRECVLDYVVIYTDGSAQMSGQWPNIHFDGGGWGCVFEGWQGTTSFFL